MYVKVLLIILITGCNHSSYSIALAQRHCQHITDSKQYTQCIKTEFPKTQDPKAKYSSDRMLCNYQAQREIDKTFPKFKNKKKYNPADYRHLFAQLKIKCMKEKGWDNENIWLY